VLVEEASTALGLLDELKGKVRGLTGIRPDRDKVTRMAIASAMFEAGQVNFPERASWLAQLEEELFSFPGGRHDDQVDSISQMLNHIKSSALWRWIRWGQALEAPSSPMLPMSAAARPWLWTDDMFCRPWWG
jgi:phage terminase large subunit-like protein